MKDETDSGKSALGACLQRCRAEFGDEGVGTFRKLIEFLVQSSMQ